MKVIVTICRLLVGLLFIFSGLIKANDPLGFSYKLDEYFEIFHMPFLIPITVYLAMFICIFEIVVGVMVLLGSYMRAATWLLLLMIVFFTFLTGYSAISGKVTECGCFGDAIKLKPWESFWKDIILLVLIIVLFIFRDRIKPLFRKPVNDALLVFATVVTTAFTVYCYMYLPVKDFRAYRVGNDIRAQMTVPENAIKDSVVTLLVYRNIKTGEEKAYSMEDYPWQDTLNFEFVRSQLDIVREGDKPAITDFRVWDADQKDVTLKVLDSPVYKIWVVAYNLEKTSRKGFEKVTKLAQDAEKNNIAVYGITSSPYDVTDPFRHEVNAAFPFYYGDQTVLKTIVRANPGIVLLHGSKVLGMWHHNATPDIEDVLKKTQHSKK